MTKIASELGSQYEYGGNVGTSSIYKDSARDNQLNETGQRLQSSHEPLTTEVLVSSVDLAGTQTVFDDKRESVKSQVEKLANTRKEIKKLIKIQNKHSKLLKQL